MSAFDIGKLNSYFGEGVVLKGSLKFRGILRMDGDFEGDITSGETLIIGKSGKVRASVTTNELYNYGGIVGDVTASEKISLHADSSLKGNINSPLLNIEEWALFQGRCEMPVRKRAPTGKSPKVSSGLLPSIKPQEKFSDGTGATSSEGFISPKKAVVGLMVMALAAGAVWAAIWGFGGDSEERLIAEKMSATKPEPVEPKDISSEVKSAPKMAKKKVNKLSEKDQLKRAIRKKPLDPQPRLKLALKTLRARDYHSAITYLEDAVKVLPADMEIRMLLARTYQTVGREKKAQKHFNAIAKAKTRSPEAQNNRAYERMEKGALGQAAVLFRNVLSSDPENNRAMLGLATVYSRLGKNDKATKECLKILRRTNDYAPAMNRLAWIYAKQGIELDEAKSLSENSIRIFGDIPEYIDTLSEVNYKMGKYGKAIELIKRAIALAPNESYYERQLFKFQRAQKQNS